MKSQFRTFTGALTKVCGVLNTKSFWRRTILSYRWLQTPNDLPETHRSKCNVKWVTCSTWGLVVDLFWPCPQSWSKDTHWPPWCLFQTLTRGKPWFTAQRQPRPGVTTGQKQERTQTLDYNSCGWEKVQKSKMELGWTRIPSYDLFWVCFELTLYPLFDNRSERIWFGDMMKWWISPSVNQWARQCSVCHNVDSHPFLSKSTRAVKGVAGARG